MNEQQQTVSPETLPPIDSKTQFWKIAPGEKAHLWPACRDGKYIAIGWPAVGDVRGISLEELETRRLAVLNDPVQTAKDRYTRDSVRQVWDFANQIKIGDRILANGGFSKILGLGIVTGECELHPEDESHPSRLPVFWYDVEEKNINERSWANTLRKLTRERFESIINPPPPPIMKTFPLNQIFYGPPGTGKTFNTIRRAVEIITGLEYSRHEDAKIKFDELHAAGRIGFVTFHQSFGYEDFVEGLRPVLVSEGATNSAAYDIRDGVLKKMALQALIAALERQPSTNAMKPTFATLWDDLQMRVSQDPNIEIGSLSGNSRYSVWTTTQANFQGRNLTTGAASTYSCSRQSAERIYSAFPDQNVISGAEVLKTIGNCQHFFIAAIVNELKEAEREGSVNSVVEVDDEIDWENEANKYLNGSRDYQLNPNPPNFVLIIDEINRGNISKILGELITLLETDKRIGNPNALTLTLPYSGEEFGLPSNLYLIGTMNTADKSLALLDVALRRRFKFEEMPPNFSVCEKLSHSTRQILEALNERITLRKDRDHRIGHAFFVDASDADFNAIFRDDIIPLLQEYFYNDWEGLRFALGERGESGAFIRKLKNSDNTHARNKWQWFFDESPDAEFDCLYQLKNNLHPAAGSTPGGDATGE